MTFSKSNARHSRKTTFRVTVYSLNFKYFSVRDMYFYGLMNWSCLNKEYHSSVEYSRSLYDVKPHVLTAHLPKMPGQSVLYMRSDKKCHVSACRREPATGTLRNRTVGRLSTAEWRKNIARECAFPVWSDIFALFYRAVLSLPAVLLCKVRRLGCLMASYLNTKHISLRLEHLFWMVILVMLFTVFRSYGTMVDRKALFQSLRTEVVK